MIPSDRVSTSHRHQLILLFPPILTSTTSLVKLGASLRPSVKLIPAMLRSPHPRPPFTPCFIGKLKYILSVSPLGLDCIATIILIAKKRPGLKDRLIKTTAPSHSLDSPLIPTAFRNPRNGERCFRRVRRRFRVR
ncbi:hypothetical protein BDZ94DRAFT_1271030 [Collybia nuda]|uniref:Uncharacterized protein n=1 Tax=Collybia nuda TaxID=64659 RepID=A0A9P5XYX8_9AGAR|nr:hypothetical protein BDZ94DRAFT_1271030 [Collybia nuda]